MRHKNYTAKDIFINRKVCYTVETVTNTACAAFPSECQSGIFFRHVIHYHSHTKQFKQDPDILV